MRDNDLFKKSRSDEIEQGALKIFRDYLDEHCINYSLAENDKTPLLDGKIYIENVAYDVQIKGVGKGSSHNIDLKYLEFAEKNFILYVIIDNVLVDTVESVIYYKTLNEHDIVKAMNNTVNISKNRLNFLILNDITSFAQYVDDSFIKFCKRRSVGIDLSENLELLQMEQTIVFTSKLDENYNIYDIEPKSFSYRNIETNNIFSPKVDSSTFVLKHIGYKTCKEVIVPNTDIKIKCSYNMITNITNFEYNDLLIHYNHTSKMIKWKITNFNLDLKKINIYKDYIRILDFFVPNKVNVFDDGIALKDKVFELENFKAYINPFELNYGELKKEILDTLWLVYKNKDNPKSMLQGHRLVTINNSINCLCYNDGKTIELKHNQNYCKVYYLDDDGNEVVITDNSYTFYFVKDNVNERHLNIYNIDYHLILKLDEENIRNVYPDDLLGVLLFNYLKIYWRYRTDIELINTLEEYTKYKVNLTNCIPFFVNYMQMKKILNFNYTNDEIDKLNGYLKETDIKDDNVLMLCIHTILENRLMAKNIFFKLCEQEKSAFMDYPIYELYKKL